MNYEYIMFETKLNFCRQIYEPNPYLNKFIFYKNGDIIYNNEETLLLTKKFFTLIKKSRKIENSNYKLKPPMLYLYLKYNNNKIKSLCPDFNLKELDASNKKILKNIE